MNPALPNKYKQSTETRRLLRDNESFSQAGIYRLQVRFLHSLIRCQILTDIIFKSLGSGRLTSQLYKWTREQPAQPHQHETTRPMQKLILFSMVPSKIHPKHLGGCALCYMFFALKKQKPGLDIESEPLFCRVRHNADTHFLLQNTKKEELFSG